jgi:transglutaminase-like putative cysteine protease
MMAHTRKGRSLEGAFRRALFWAILGAYLSFAIADANAPYLVIFGAATVGVWFGSVRLKHPAPRLAINAVLMVVVAIAGIETLRSGIGVSTFAVFVALLLVVKLLDLRQPRDDGQVLVLCLSVMVAAVLTSNSFMTGVAMLVESVLLLRAFILFQLHSVVQLGRSPSRRLGRRARIDARSMTLGSGFLCLVIAVGIFLVLPRNLGSQAFGQWGAGQSVSGFSDAVQLGRPGRISMSSKPVLDLVMRDRNGTNIGAENSPPIYLRGAVLEEYTNGNWSASSIFEDPLEGRISLRPARDSLKPPGSMDNTRWDRQYEISLRDVSDGLVYLFAPWRTVEFRTGETPVRIGRDFSRGVFLKDGIGNSVLNYVVRCINDEFRSPRYAGDLVRNPSRSEEVDPRIRELAEQILRDGGIDPEPGTRPIEEDAAAVRLLETHLRTQYTYSLDAQPVPPGMDATRWFLFEGRSGHCEYYASALTLMSRSIGVPARVLTGYIASDFNSVTGQYVVRESNAHAWIEAEIAPGMWRTFDGTPPSDFHDLHVPDPGIIRSALKMYESIEFLWGRAIVGYDSEARNQIVGRRVGDFGLSRLSDRLLARISAGRSKLVSRAAVVALVVFSLAMFIGIALLRWQVISRLLHKLVTSWLSKLGLTREAETGTRELRRLENVVNSQFAHAGIPRPTWRPLKQHLREHKHEFSHKPMLFDAISDAAQLIYAQRFARDVIVDPEQVENAIGRIHTSEK